MRLFNGKTEALQRSITPEDVLVEWTLLHARLPTRCVESLASTCRRPSNSTCNRLEGKRDLQNHCRIAGWKGAWRTPSKYRIAGCIAGTRGGLQIGTKGDFSSSGYICTSECRSQQSSKAEVESMQQARLLSLLYCSILFHVRTPGAGARRGGWGRPSPQAGFR